MPRPPVTLRTQRLLLTQPPPEDAQLVVDYYERNRAHLEPWEPSRDARFFTAAFWADRLRRNHEELAQDRSLRLFLVQGGGDDAEVVGSCNFTEIVRGPFQCVTLGFGLDHRLEGQGFMHEALRAAIDHVFDALSIHRIQANHQPQNLRSAALLRRLGFVVEGYARDYLRLDGAWRDHVLCSLTNPRWA